MTQGNEELWQAYDERGEQIAGKSMTKPQAADGALHGCSHVWIWRGEGDNLEILLQERAKDKRTWPGYFDISAAGHIDFKEVPLATALRETKEELGFDIDPLRLRLLFMHRQKITDQASSIIENEFQWVYGLQLKDTGVQLTYDDEVDSIAWLKLSDFRSLVSGELSDKRIVPHGDAYFAELLKEITRSYS